MLREIFLVVFASSLLSFSGGVFSQNHPLCVSGSSDMDGDGYGWENNATCIVSTESTDGCEDRGDYPWGWNPARLESCRLDAGQKNELRELLLGEWVCKDMVITSSYFDPGISSSGAVVNDSVRWAPRGISISDSRDFPNALPTSCRVRSGAQHPNISKIELRSDGTLIRSSSYSQFSACELNPGFELFYEVVETDWSSSGNIITLGDTAYIQVGFETKTEVGIGGNVKLSNKTHFYLNNYSRVTCMAASEVMDPVSEIF